jgi:hypothetical protein
MCSRGGLKVADLLALTPQRDPFYIMPVQRREAEWFSDVFRRFQRPHLYLRGLHYILVTLPGEVLKPDGTPYVNNDQCWNWLTSASTAARYLGLVAPDELEDHRNLQRPRSAVTLRDQEPEPWTNVEKAAWIACSGLSARSWVSSW